MIKGVGKKGDVLIGLSTSGNSVNIINAFVQAKELGMTTVAFTGSYWWENEKYNRLPY